MSTWFIVVMGIVTFLIVLNGYANGTLTRKIDAFLGVLIVIGIVYSIYEYGWMNGLYTIVGMVVFGGICKFILGILGVRSYRI